MILSVALVSPRLPGLMSIAGVCAAISSPPKGELDYRYIWEDNGEKLIQIDR